MMRNFNVLFTCCGNHAIGRIKLLKNNEDGVNVNVYTCNMDESKMPPMIFTDGNYVAPRINDKRYIPFLLQLCEELRIDIIVPTVTLELDFMASNAHIFEERGIKVSISPAETIAVANNKIKLHKRFSNVMPLQLTTHDFQEATTFKKRLPRGSKMCCKLPNFAGGNGFAIIDNEKAVDPTLFNRFGTDRYISMRDLKEMLATRSDDILLQEYKEGYDYSVCVLANFGIVSHIVGFAGYTMSYGAIIDGEILYNATAYKIADDICSILKIDGNACFDFRIGKDDEVTLLEINPRVSASLPFVREAGVNMLYLRCKNLLGDFSDLDKSYPIKYGLKMRKYYETVYYE